MQLTRAADYAVRIMIHLATLPSGSCPSGAELASAQEIPEHFAIKVLQGLVRARLLASYRGSGGGFALAVDPEQISLLDVVEAIEGPTALNLCLTQPSSCARHPLCAAHRVWVEAQAAMTGVLRAASIASLAAQTLQEGRWISLG
jgi:Rrf2 family protein